MGENLTVVGDRGEYPEKDKRTGQLTGNKVKNINGYVEEKWIDADEDLRETSYPNMADEYTSKKIEIEMENEAETRKIIKQPKYTAETYWKDKFLLDVERQESYKANNETIIRECAIKAATEIVVGKVDYLGITSVDSYFEFADRITEWIKDENAFKLRTEANLIISGLSPLKKAEIIDWINNVRMGTDIEDDEQFLIKLNVQVLPAQTVKELRETVDTMMKYFYVTKGE